MMRLLTMIPMLWTAWLIWTYSVGSFHSDQWNDMLPVVAKSLDGSLTFADLWKSHYEHRLFVPRCIMLGLARLTGWDTRYESWLQFGLAAVTLYNLHRIRLIAGGSKWVMPFASLMIFSPMGWENFMLGFQVHFWIPVACFTAAPWLAHSTRPLLYTTLVSLVATFSIASGFLCWFVSLAALLHRYGWKERLPDLIAWLAVPIVAIPVYFLRLSEAVYPGKGHMLSALETPVASALHFASYFGNGFVQSTHRFADYEIARVIGLAFLALCVVAASVLQHRLKWHLAPWFILIVLALAISAATTMGRSHILPMQSRYLPFAVLLPISLLFILSHIKPRVALAVGAALTTLTLLWSSEAFVWWQAKQEWVIVNRDVARMVDRVPDKDLATVILKLTRVDNLSDTIGYLRVLEREGYLK